MHNQASGRSVHRWLSLRALLAVACIAVTGVAMPAALAQTLQLVEDSNTRTDSMLSDARPYGDRAAIRVQLGERPDYTVWGTDGTIDGTTPLSFPFDVRYWAEGYAGTIGDWIVYESNLSDTNGLWLHNIVTGEARRLTTTNVDARSFGNTLIYEELEGPSPRPRWRLDPLTNLVPVPLPGTAPLPGGGAVRLGDEVFFTRLHNQSMYSIWSFSLATGTSRQRTQPLSIIPAIMEVGGYLVGREFLGTGRFAIYRFDPRTDLLDHRVLMDQVSEGTFGAMLTAAGRFWMVTSARLPSGIIERVVYRYNPINAGLDVIPIPMRNTWTVIDDPIVTHDAIYYAGYSTTTGYELFRLRANSTEPELVAEVRSGPADAVALDGLHLHNGRVYFLANDGVHGKELWVHDPGTGSTQFVKDINPGPADSSVRFLGATNDTGPILFAADDGVHGSELWRSDGTEAGTYLLRDFQAGTNGIEPRYLRVVNGRLVYSGRSRGVGEPSIPLVESGTPYLNQPQAKAIRTPTGRELLYFSSSSSNGLFIAATDGTPEGTRQLANPPGINSIMPCGSGGSTNAINGLLDNLGIISVQLTGVECRPWLIRATDSGLTDASQLQTPLGNRISYATGSSISSGELVYFAPFTHDFGYELLRTDGTQDGTVFVDLCPGASGSNPTLHLATGSTLFLTASPTPASKGLYKAVWPHGAPSPALTQLAPVFSSSAPAYVALTGSRLLYTPTDSGQPQSLWSVNVDTLARQQISSLFPWSGMNPSLSEPAYMPVGDRLCFFAAETSASPSGVSPKPFAYDSRTNSVVRLAQSSSPNATWFAPVSLVTVRNQLLFAFNDGVHGQELWITDGTPGGTRLWLDAVPGPASSSPTEAAVVENVLYLAASTPEFGGELYSVQLCASDMNLDFAVTIDDLITYLVAFESGDPLGDIGGDDGRYLPDGSITIDDLLLYLFAFEQGC